MYNLANHIFELFKSTALICNKGTVLQLLLVLIISLYLLGMWYVKSTYKFWAYQPVFHYYNLWYWVCRAKIIDKRLPTKNRFCDFEHIETKSPGTVDDTTETTETTDTTETTEFISNHYLVDNPAYKYTITPRGFDACFTNHSNDSFISIFRQMGGTEIIGTMTTRSLYARINQVRLPVYYVDHLCVHRDHRGKNIATSLIQTHEYNQRHSAKHTSASIFKREGTVLGIVPIVAYMSVSFHIGTVYNQRTSVRTNERTNERLRLVAFNESTSGSAFERHFTDMMTLINCSSSTFDLFILPHADNIRSQIIAKILFPTIVYNESTSPPTPIAIFVFKDIETYNRTTVTEPATEPATDTTPSSVAQPNCMELNVSYISPGYSTAEIIPQVVRHISRFRDSGFANIIIERISDNDTVLRAIESNESFVRYAVSPCAYFMYNYIARPCDATKTFVVV